MIDYVIFSGMKRKMEMLKKKIIFNNTGQL